MGIGLAWSFRKLANISTHLPIIGKKENPRIKTAAPRSSTPEGEMPNIGNGGSIGSEEDEPRPPTCIVATPIIGNAENRGRDRENLQRSTMPGAMPNIGLGTAGTGVNNLDFVLFDFAALADAAEYRRYTDLLFPSISASTAEREESGDLNGEGLQETFAVDLMNFGKVRGKDYASVFVAQFVGWIGDTAGLRGPLHVDAVISLAFQAFGVEVGLEMPIVRNFLSALKRHAGVKVHQDRRMYDDQRRFIGKGTFYSFPANAVGDGDPLSTCTPHSANPIVHG